MKEKSITIILTILIILLPMAIMPSISNDYNMPKLIILLSGGVLLLIFFLANYKKIEIDKKDILLLIFAMLIFISTMLSKDLKISILGAEKRYEGMLTLFTYILIYFCTKKFLNYKNKNNLLKVLDVIYISICILGVLQYYIKIPNKNLYPIFNKGVCGTFGNTNFIGSFLSLGIPAFTTLYIVKGKKISFITSILVFFCLIVCGARSSWVAFAVFVFILLIYLIKMKNKEYLKRTAILFVCFALIFTYLFTAKSSFVRTKVNAISNDVKTASVQGINEKMGSSRIQIWRITTNLIKKYPIFGIGTDDLKNSLHRNMTDDYEEFIKRTNSTIDKAHNEYLQIAATLGIPALVIYLVFIVLVLKGKEKQIFNNLNIFIIYSSIICYLVQAFFNISTIGVAPLFWFALGLIDNKMINKDS